jgi:hypothetical protein
MGVTILRRAATATYKFLGGTMLSFLSSLTVSPPRRPAQGELAVSYPAWRLLHCCCSDHNGARWLIPYNKTIPKLRMIDTRPLPYCVSDLATTTTIHNLLTDILGCSHVGQYITRPARLNYTRSFPPQDSIHLAQRLSTGPSEKEIKTVGAIGWPENGAAQCAARQIGRGKMSRITRCVAVLEPVERRLAASWTRRSRWTRCSWELLGWMAWTRQGIPAAAE